MMLRVYTEVAQNVRKLIGLKAGSNLHLENQKLIEPVGLPFLVLSYRSRSLLHKHHARCVLCWDSPAKQTYLIFSRHVDRIDNLCLYRVGYESFRRLSVDVELFQSFAQLAKAFLLRCVVSSSLFE